VIRLAVAAVVLLAAIAGAQEPTASDLEALRQRGLRGATAIVEGHIYMEGRKPKDPSEPVAGVGVLLVPRSADLLEHLEAVKRRSRESAEAFRDAAPAAHAAIEEYETELWQRGYPDAAIRAVTDERGVFSAVVPAGAWTVVVQRRTYVPIRAQKAESQPSASALDPLARYSTSQYQHFLKVAPLTGFDAVSVWLREVDVEAGQHVVLDLHDRGVWLSGVIEETATPQRVRNTGRGPRR
jgi:hypothetical protein